MLNTNLYKTQILELYNQGIKPEEIAKILNFKYHQPVYNLLKKEGIFIPKETLYARKYSIDETFFENINSEEKAYIFGFICADGHIDFKRKCITIDLAEKDIEVLHKIKEVMKSSQPITTSYRENPYLLSERKILTMKRLQLNSVKLVEQLSKLGIENNKTYTLSSKVLNNIPDRFVRDFLRGYFDGDGNILFNKKYSSGTKYNINVCGNEEFLLNTYQKYFPSKNKMYFEKKSKQMFVWKISSKEEIIKFLEYLYKDSKIYLCRKFVAYEHAHLKQEELLGTPTLERQKDNQQPSLISNDFEGSTTNSQIQTDNAEDSNANTSILQLYKTIDDIV